MPSQKTKYALRAPIMLAEHASDEMVAIVDIAEQENIPRKFIEAILVQLRKAGRLYAKCGGYRIAPLLCAAPISTSPATTARTRRPARSAG